MLLYNKQAVKRKKKVTQEQVRLARAENLFYLPSKVTKSARGLEANIKTRKDLFGHMVALAQQFHNMIRHDFRHNVKGVRTATGVLLDKRADCIEQAILLRTVFQNLGKKVRRRLGWLVTKNPKGYRGASLEDIGIHPFVTYRNNSGLYAIDIAGARLMKLDEGRANSMSQAEMSNREFIAFVLGIGAEDLSFTHRKHKRGLGMVKRGLKINPNDYVLHCTVGEIKYLMGNNPKAEAAYKKAVKIAPDLADPYVMLGNFRFEAYANKDRAVQAYTQAAERETEDPHILRQLEKKLYHLGLRSLHKKTREKRQRVMDQKGIKLYKNSWL